MTSAGNKPRCRIGTSGYQYDHWRGVFYAETLSRNAWFSQYASVFDTVEINSTFYGLPRAETFDAWRERAPRGFIYALKFSRYGSHVKRLQAPAETIGVFLERATRLGAYLGPILVQLPPHWNADPARLAAFLEAAPARYRWAVELRDPDWLRPEIFAILRTHDAALCIHDMLPAHPPEVTADWIYLRFHGKHYGGSYSPQFLAAQAARIDRWLAAGLDVFAYFNNDAHGYAVNNARALKRYVENRRNGSKKARQGKPRQGI
jgi:uncharacterized protein YecE (DUF72 family)